METSAARETEADEHGHEERASGRGAARSSGTVGAELASLVTILVREPGRVTAGGGEPLVRSRGVKELLQRVVHRAGHKRAQIPCLYLLRPAVAGVKGGEEPRVLRLPAETPRSERVWRAVLARMEHENTERLFTAQASLRTTQA